MNKIQNTKIRKMLITTNEVEDARCRPREVLQEPSPARRPGDT